MQRRTLLLTLLLTFSLTSLHCGSGEAEDTADATSTAASSQDGWTTLFNGNDLEGWYNPYDWGEARVENGEVRLQADEKFFLVTEDTYDDFILEAEVKLPDTSSNSGIMFRANVDSNRVYGYQAEADPTARQWAGGLYDEGRRGWLHPTEGDEQAGQQFRETAGTAFNPTEWNQYRIRAEGDTLQISVNDTQTTRYVDSLDSEGHIGIQHHGEEGKVYRFRNIRVKELNDGSGMN